MQIIDVTLRDGGHAVDFNWPIQMAKEYYKTLSKFKEIQLIELGYWKQSAKSSKPFYNLDFELVKEITGGSSRRNVSVMIDYHYCSHLLEDYPRNDQLEISMIRLCIRKEDLEKGLEFGKRLKEYTGLDISINIFNTSNYTHQELIKTCEEVLMYDFDYVYFADTHGSLDLSKDFKKFEEPIRLLKNKKKSVGFHLHDHSGKAYSNYQELVSRNVNSTDTSVRGMGKGSGNLKLEHVINRKDLIDLLSFIQKYQDILTIKPSVYEMITAKHSLTDNYAKQASEIEIRLTLFDSICSQITGIDKDTFNSSILQKKTVEK